MWLVGQAEGAGCGGAARYRRDDVTTSGSATATARYFMACLPDMDILVCTSKKYH